jgi:hypothetical protein
LESLIYRWQENLFKTYATVCNDNIILYRIEMPWIIPLYLWILFFFLLSIKWLFPSVDCWIHFHDIV